jgi:hypothetical protein
MTIEEKQAAIEIYGYLVFPIVALPGTYVVCDPLDNEDGWSLAGTLDEVVDATLEMLWMQEPPTGPVAPRTPIDMYLTQHDA